jgi:type VI secretion system secreted protein Hcp
MTVVIAVIGFTLLTLAAVPAPAAAYSMVAVIETQTQGPLTCGNTARGQEGTQVLLGISDEVALASSEATAGGGDPGGALQVRPLVVIKELDRCSPPLFRALVNRERISLVEIRLFDRQGVHFFTIRLEDAIVTRISRVVRSHGLHEEVAFAFRAIQLVDERSGASVSHQFAG